MYIPGGNHVDRRRQLLPRDYVRGGPYGFGVDADAVFYVPVGGDPVWCRVAELEHRLILRWRAREDGPSGAAIARRWGCSKATFSRTVLGERWAGELLLAALLEAGHSSTPPK
jgi:hypothetical protein